LTDDFRTANLYGTETDPAFEHPEDVADVIAVEGQATKRSPA
jgi:hypothetical protein